MKTILYENQYFYITKCNEFPNIPGFFVIYEKENRWYSSEDSIKTLAIIEKTIRDELMKQGIELTGIYREEYEDNKFRILIIPYDVNVLEQNNISPDLYQPYIKKYLESFNINNNYCYIDDEKILTKLRRLKNE